MQDFLQHGPHPSGHIMQALPAGNPVMLQVIEPGLPLVRVFFLQVLPGMHLPVTGMQFAQCGKWLDDQIMGFSDQLRPVGTTVEVAAVHCGQGE